CGRSPPGAAAAGVIVPVIWRERSTVAGVVVAVGGGELVLVGAFPLAVVSVLPCHLLAGGRNVTARAGLALQRGQPGGHAPLAAAVAGLLGTLSAFAAPLALALETRPGGRGQHGAAEHARDREREAAQHEQVRHTPLGERDGEVQRLGAAEEDGKKERATDA